jgi:hypothetical protein
MINSMYQSIQSLHRMAKRSLSICTHANDGSENCSTGNGSVIAEERGDYQNKFHYKTGKTISIH